MDISMSAIYSYYDAEQTEKLLEIYLKRKSKEEYYSVFANATLGGSSGACGLYTRQP